MTSINKSSKERLIERQNELFHRTKRSLGQNFLVSDGVIDKIIQAVNEENPTQLLEIGPGLGALTDLLKEKYRQYTLIELDKSLVEYWINQQMNVIEGDALQIDWGKIKYDVLVSNLPYQISSSIVIDRSLDHEQCRSMILMFQKEVAQRIRALPKTEDYGMLSVIAQEFWTIKTVCDAGPRDFSPAPKVASRVLKFHKKESDIQFKDKYLAFVKTCFKQRRRILKSNLQAGQTETFLKWVEINKVSGKVRVEELSPIQIKNLYFYLESEK